MEGIYVGNQALISTSDQVEIAQKELNYLLMEDRKQSNELQEEHIRSED